jgi:hypothetical protein
MSDQLTPFRDSTLDLDQAYNYRLLLLVNAGSFSYAVTFKNKLLAYGTDCAIEELTGPKQLQELFSVTYKNVIVGFTSGNFTLVPPYLFNPDRIADFARVLDVKKSEKVLAQVLDDNNFVVYKVTDKQLAAIEKFNFKKIVFAVKGLVKMIAENNSLNNNIYLNITKNRLEFLYFKLDKLRFYNSFEYKNAEDIGYFSIMVSQELEMQPQYTTLTLSGKINRGDDTFNLLSEFFSDVSINKTQLLEYPANLPSHQFLSLVSLSLCGSSEVL